MPDTSLDAVPSYQKFMNPVLEVLRRGEVLSNKEVDRRVIDLMRLPPEVVAVRHKDRPSQSEVEYRIAWARTYLKKIGLLENPSRGRWQASQRGRTTDRVDPATVAEQVNRQYDERDLEQETASDELELEPSDLSEEDAGVPPLPEPLVQDLRNIRTQLAADGELPSQEALRRIFERFRERFGPRVLATLDGQALLTRMHGRPGRDSLVYWLEFKDDDEFPKMFGSIAGGSAYKFGFYRSEAGAWMGGSAQQPRQLSEDEAIDLARRQRDQFVAGDRVLADHATQREVDYGSLERALEAAAPDVAHTAWGHKYFALLYPGILDQNHTGNYQRFQAIKLLAVPAKGQYENARIFAAASRQTGIPLTDLCVTLHRRNGAGHQYWRVGTTLDGESEWPRMRAGGFMAVCWDKLEDLSAMATDAEGKDALRALVAQAYPGKESSITRDANQLYNFLKAAPGDVVVAMDGATVKGVGQIREPYYFQAGDGRFPHRHAVKWHSDAEWRLPVDEGLRTTFVKLGKHARNLVAIERHLVERREALPGAAPRAAAASTAVAESTPPPALTGMAARIEAALQRKGQVILYGPPGTGKSYWAEKAVVELAARSWFGRSADAESRQRLREQEAIQECTFHPAFGYEDFLEGYRPALESGRPTFKREDGLFKRLCRKARDLPSRKFFLLIDEINRGDVPRIFGELLTLLEKDKRGSRSITLPLSGEPFVVPPNVYVVGTMNTADRSIALLDAALRRRFAFIEMLPQGSLLETASIEGLPLGAWLDELNRQIVKVVGRDGRNLQIGHSYLMPGGAPVRDVAQFVEIFRDELLPLLEEYCYEDAGALQRILGTRMVPNPERRFDDRLLRFESHRDLIQALLTAFSSVTTTSAAIKADATAQAEDDDDEDDPEGDT